MEALARRAETGSQEEAVLLNTSHMLRWAHTQLQLTTTGVDAALRLLNAPQADGLYPTMKLKQRLTDLRKQQEQNGYVDKFQSK